MEVTKFTFNKERGSQWEESVTKDSRLVRQAKSALRAVRRNETFAKRTVDMAREYGRAGRFAEGGVFIRRKIGGDIIDVSTLKNSCRKCGLKLIDNYNVCLHCVDAYTELLLQRQNLTKELNSLDRGDKKYDGCALLLSRVEDSLEGFKSVSKDIEDELENE